MGEDQLLVDLPPVSTSDLLSYWKFMHEALEPRPSSRRIFPLPPRAELERQARAEQAAPSRAENDQRVDGRSQSIHARATIIAMMVRYQLLNDWVRGDHIDEAALRVIAAYPLNPLYPGMKNPFPLMEILEEIKKASSK